MPPHATRRATLIGATAVLLWGGLATLTVLSGNIPPFQLLAMCFALGTVVGLAAQWGRARRFALGRWPAASWGQTRRSAPSGQGRGDAPSGQTRRSAPTGQGRGDAPSGQTRRSAPTGWVWALGIYGLFGYHFAYFMALRLAPPAAANLINYLWPVLIVLFAALLPGERLRGRQVAGALAGFAGAGLLVTGGGLRFDSHHLPGYAFALACAVIWSSYSVLSRRVGRGDAGGPRGETDSARAVTGYCAATAALALVCHLLLETPVWPVGWQWAAVVALGLGPLGVAFYTWDHGVKHGNIQTLGALAYAAPLLSTALLIAVGLAEPSWALAAAGALIIGGAALAS